MAKLWENDDGLRVRFGNKLAETAKSGTASDNHSFDREAIILIDTQSDGFPAFGDTPAFLSEPTSAIPGGAIIRDCTLVVLEGFTSGGAPTLALGLKDEDGNEIDHDGLIAATALVALAAPGDEVVGAGALIGTQLANEGYASIEIAVADYTAGKALVKVSYILPQ